MKETQDCCVHHLEYSVPEHSNTEMNSLEEESLDVMWEGSKSSRLGVQKYGS